MKPQARKGLGPAATKAVCNNKSQCCNGYVSMTPTTTKTNVRKLCRYIDDLGINTYSTYESIHSRKMAGPMRNTKDSLLAHTLVIFLMTVGTNHPLSPQLTLKPFHHHHHHADFQVSMTVFTRTMGGRTVYRTLRRRSTSLSFLVGAIRMPGVDLSPIQSY
jgi:hypothetical protein